MRRDQLAEHTAVTETRQQLDAARTALLDIAGGPEGIITERDIIARRVTAQHADINVLNLARAHARELDSPLARVEAAAARAALRHRTSRPQRPDG